MKRTLRYHSTASWGIPSPAKCSINSSLILEKTSSNFARRAALAVAICKVEIKIWEPKDSSVSYQVLVSGSVGRRLNLILLFYPISTEVLQVPTGDTGYISGITVGQEHVYNLYNRTPKSPGYAKVNPINASGDQCGSWFSKSDWLRTREQLTSVSGISI